MTHNKSSTRYYSSLQEKKVAKSLQGKVVPNSGAATFVGGDVTIDNLILIECKTCTKEKKSFSIKKEWLEKNEEEKFEMGIPYSALAFDFGDGKQNYIINEKLFRRLVDVLREEESNVENE